jgi:hypothetical protein
VQIVPVGSLQIGDKFTFLNGVVIREVVFCRTSSLGLTHLGYRQVDKNGDSLPVREIVLCDTDQVVQV